MSTQLASKAHELSDIKHLLESRTKTPQPASVNSITLTPLKQNYLRDSQFTKKQFSIVSKTTKESRSAKKGSGKVSEEKMSKLSQSIIKNEEKLKQLERRQKTLDLELSGVIDYRKLQKSGSHQISSRASRF